MKLNPDGTLSCPDQMQMIVSQFLYYAHAMDIERFTETEKQLIILYYLKLKNLLDALKIKHHLNQLQLPNS